jgi:hypothetical protein
LIDATGLRVHVGNMRRPTKHRDWRKLHITVDALTGDVRISIMMGCPLDHSSRRLTASEPGEIADHGVAPSP